MFPFVFAICYSVVALLGFPELLLFLVGFRSEMKPSKFAIPAFCDFQEP